MEDKINALQEEINQYSVQSEEELEAYRMRFISRKSVIGDLLGAIKDVAPEKRKEAGMMLNQLKNDAQAKFKALITELESQKASAQAIDVPDLTLPPIPDELGAIHPLTQVRNRIVEIFERIGFQVVDGPEIEDDRHNFTALNFPPNHPAREMQDTFFIEKNPDMVLRTHTSSVQIRMMEDGNPPFRAIMPGRVFRNEAISARAHCVFHQVEGLYVDKNVSFADLKQTLLHFAKELFGPETGIRLRPSYFPFTEPSAELDIWWGNKTEADKRITKGTGWLEIGGCGMVDPFVLESCGIDPEEYTGFAFGMGIERIAMIKYQIKDLRLFTENDIRFLKQFSQFN
ncbi:phenylalanyl-tRNA synthetase alpha chain [Catalinimonas alkaloidigena]|uniref:phenylalanine--tRNA ligase subunit alpha n=1 Tax=Catalinimonas alkaloidigena TaxID=1075417 RepID=UPI002404BBAB|nr:phenylalanine--tRNA ligase subunit alpha [Catalinimonas alkaloidigena]MDF9797398.1 phenylalanyl-tRNA synthetase alpha chain [Catalinimonas alkaloidigena]